VKSHWRHVRTRLYFTSASHLYTLLNTLKFGLDSILIDQSNPAEEQALMNIDTLDYMSSIVFRLHENFLKSKSDPKRFKLELMVGRGAEVKADTIPVEDHTVKLDINNYVHINKQLTMQDVDNFFKTLLEMQTQTS